MYNNIGKKIKGLAVAFCIIQIVAAVITGFALVADDDDFIPVALLIMLIAPVIAWISSWMLYGFGELIDKVCDIERNTRGNNQKSQFQSNVDAERIRKIESLRAQGLISEEEYRQAISTMR